MKRRILLFLLAVLLADTTFGLDLSLAPGLSVQNAILYLIMTGFMIETAVLRNRQFELLTVLFPFFLLIVYCILSWFVASFIAQPEFYDPIRTFIALKGERVDHFIIFTLFFYGVSTSEDTLGLIRAFLWMMVLGNLLTIIDGFNIPDLGIIQQREDGRVGGPMGESNQYGAFLVFLLPALVALLSDNRTKKVYAYFAFATTVLALMAASSRGAFVGLAIGGLIGAIYLRSVITMRQIVFGLIASIVVAILFIIVLLTTDIFADIVQRLVEKSTGAARSISSGRTAIWAAAIKRMLEFPLSFVIGYGWDSYDHMRGFTFNTHNSYLNILFNLGSIGLVIYLVLLKNLVAYCRRAIKVVGGTVRAHLMAFVFGLFSLSAALFFVELYQPWVFIWAYTGMIMRLAVLTLQQEAQKTESRRVLL